MPVKGIAVGWMSYFDSLRRAVALGCNLFVTHEPTYYDHLDADRSVFEFDIARAKKEVRSLREKLASLEEEFEQKVEKIKTSFGPVDIELEEVSIRPRKSDIQVSRMALAWTLWRKRADDLWEPAY